MNTNHKLGSVRELALFGRLLRGSLIATAVFALAFVVAPYIMSEVNAANNVSSVITWSAIDLTLDPDVAATSGAADPAAEQALSTHGDVEFGGIVPTAKNTTAGDYGTLKVERKTIGVTTRGKYYTVFLSMEGSNQDLNFTYNDTTDTNVKIAKTSGTWASPKTLAQNGTSGWGYMVPGATTKDSSGNASPFASLTQSGVSSTFNGKLDTALYRDDGVAYTSSIWAAVPVSTSAQQIWKNTTDAGAGFSTQDTFDVYYAVNVDTDVLSGTYQNNVVYTALASAASLDNYSTNLVRTLKFGASGNKETLYFDLAQIGTPVTADKIGVKMVPHNEMAASGVDFDPSKLSSSVLNAALTCAVDKSSFETVTATQDGRSGSTSKIECELPTGGIVADASASTKGDGAYDFILTIDGLNYTYVSKINDGAEPGFVYAGLQSADDTADTSKYVKNMQEMTVGVCENTNRWGNTLGSNAKLYTPDGAKDITSTATLGTWSGSTFTPSTTADGVGSFALKDTRDGKRYIVRRLADGQCWMAQNLNLDLYTGMTLTNEDTNLTTRDTWVLTDSANSNNELTMASNKSLGDLAWVPNAGSTSRAWQIGHGVETARIVKYTYNDGSWTRSVIAECKNGTAQTPCFVAKTAETYYYPDGTQALAANAASDEYLIGTTSTGSLLKGFNNGAYYVRVTYQVRQVNANTTGAWSARNVGANNVTDSNTTCSFNYYWNHLQSGEACVIETEGPTMLTQFSNNATGIGLNTLELPRMNISLDHTGTYTAPTTTTSGATYTGANTIDFMNNTTSRTSVAGWFDQNWYTSSSLTTYPMQGSGADYRWEQNGRDGVHVLDLGPLYFNFSITDDGTTYTASNGGNGGTACGTIGTVSGTLKLSDETLSFVSCKDSDGNALADTRVDGNWYNYYAAVAGASINNSGIENPKDSICPKGWTLPADGGSTDTSDFATLITTNYSLTEQNDTKVRAFPLSFARSGYYYWYGAGLGARGGYGYYWSSGSYDGTDARSLYFLGSSLSPRGGYYKGLGFAVRCVASSV